MAAKKEPFERSLAKLEAIVKKLESGDLPLEEALKAFEEGVRLSRLCAERLEEAKQRVEILLKESGQLTPKPFEPEEGE